MVDTPMLSLHNSTQSITPPSPFVFYSPSSLYDGASSTLVDYGLLSPSLSLSPLPVPQGANFMPDTFPFDVVYRQAVSEGELVIVMLSPTVGATQALPTTGQSFTAPVITEKVHDVAAETEYVADAVTEMESDETSIDVDTGPLFSDDDEPQNDDVDNEWMDEVQDADMCKYLVMMIIFIMRNDEYEHLANVFKQFCASFENSMHSVMYILYITLLESITLKQGKTNYFITTNMLEILGDRFIQKLHEKIFAYAQTRAAQVKAKEAQARVEKEKVTAEERKLAAEKEKAEAERERTVAEAGRDSALHHVEELQVQLAMFNSQQLSFGINSF
ncbi:hypothetical protein C8Q75DRAFT_804933 [Abortiporus biennis]|nr:hypothetical protein C8Q75DRAFT_804933 [Abortiporus biennis]